MKILPIATADSASTSTRRVGLSLAKAWCLKFVHWCYTQAGIRLGVPNPLPKIYLVSAFLDWARKDNSVVATPRKGDIMVKKPAMHAGLVLTEPVANSFSSVEGNTWTTDQEKEGVYVVKRLHVINYELVRIES